MSLPRLPRVTGGSGGRGTLQLVATPALQEGLALLDSPDIDSVLAENRALANQLLAAADGWLFVTTAARYADAVPWEFLRSARERGTVLSIVLNRVPGDADREVPAHLRQMLADERLGDRLDRAVAGADLSISRPRWWRPVGLLQSLLAVAVAAGAIWLAVLAVLGWLRIEDVAPLPDLEGIPIPTWLLLGGTVTGIVLGFLARLVNGAGANRRARRAARSLRERVDAVATEPVAGPVERELDAHERLCAAVETARNR